ncbi:MAG TPA: hypothetical protein VFC73_07490 [Syntrophomonadaceae bacterium]|nr:hypothetical protein [Syntrophomonadaceae bacterium]
MAKGVPKKDGSGKGKRSNQGRGGCKDTSNNTNKDTGKDGKGK